jgi:hypothetical protein
MNKVFICYRRDDSRDISFNLYKALCRRFGDESVFIDIESIPYSVDFREHVRKSLEDMDVVVAVVGNRWLDARNEDGKRRLDNPDNFVRVELQTAFALERTVVPLLVGQAEMPRESDLPPALGGFAFRNAAELREGPKYDSQLTELLDGIATVPPAQRGLIENSIGMKLKLILAGSLLMGSPDADEAAKDWEKPQHLVEITKPFFLGIYPGQGGNS